MNQQSGATKPPLFSVSTHASKRRLGGRIMRRSSGYALGECRARSTYFLEGADQHRIDRGATSGGCGPSGARGAPSHQARRCVRWDGASTLHIAPRPIGLRQWLGLRSSEDVFGEVSGLLQARTCFNSPSSTSVTCTPRLPSTVTVLSLSQRGCGKEEAIHGKTGYCRAGGGRGTFCCVRSP